DFADPRVEPTVSEREQLRRLWARQSTDAAGPEGGELEYVRAHFSLGIALERRLRVIDMIVPYIRGRVLEWGCRHALDSCVYRMRLGERVDLHGCDVCAPATSRVFHSFSRLRYRRLNHPFQLDYDDGAFDV